MACSSGFAAFVTGLLLIAVCCCCSIFVSADLFFSFFCSVSRFLRFLAAMSDPNPKHRLPRGTSATKINERRSKTQNDKLKAVQVEQASKETNIEVGKKRKKSGKDSRNQKGIELFVKQQPKLAPHISSYTNTSIVSELREKLTPDQLQQFGNTCFGLFLKMKRLDVQQQLFRCFMSRQIIGTPDNIFSVHVNGTVLQFSLREFALVTGLKCVGRDQDFEFEETPPNRLIVTYSGSAKAVKKIQLSQVFNDKAWGPDNDEDALKISLLYFIETFIFSSEKNNTTIPKLHFDLVESGRYAEYHWGIKAFEQLISSISKKFDAVKQYYRIAGMPLAMQVWFYECCSNVDSKIAFRVDDLVPRILNWKTTGNQPTFSYLMNGLFRDTENTVVFKDITPLEVELAVIQIPPECADIDKTPTPAHSDKSLQETDDFSPTPTLQSKQKLPESVGPSSSPPHKKLKQQPQIPTKDPSNNPKGTPVFASDVGPKIVHDHQLPKVQDDEVTCLRQELNSFKEYVVGEFESLRTLISDNFKMIADQIQSNQQTKPKVENDFGLDPDVADNRERHRPSYHLPHIKRMYQCNSTFLNLNWTTSFYPVKFLKLEL